MSHEEHGDHLHDGSLVLEDDAGNRDGEDRVTALQRLLVRRGLVTPGEITLEVEKLEAPNPEWGAALVARAWVDPDYRARLLENGKEAAAELGYRIGEAQLVVVDNTERVHNVIVCTLCSCYPRSLLGQPPAWYTSKAYRARCVREPRNVLSEFGLDLPESMELYVHDSNADMRYMVLPRRPPETDDLTEAELRKLVTRDSLIGVTEALEPALIQGARE